MGGTISNDIYSESTQQLHTPKFMYTTWVDLYQSWYKNCEILNFGFLPHFVFANMGLYGSKRFKQHL